MVTLMYENTHTQKKNSAKKKQNKKQTNKHPPPQKKKKKKKNIFMFCLNLLQYAKILFRFFIWRKKERDLTQ